MGLLSRFARRSPGATEKDRAPAAAPKRRFHGVEVIPGASVCCDGAREIAGKRFLTDEAPILPLTDCDQPECSCRYQHYTDRRTDDRRDTDVGIGFAADLYRQQCRRGKSRGRRRSDKDRD
ncbi:MAG: hypothetical protein P8172_14360 [Gammaproteobacteria bacterium]|jgi:hypothetical protein